MRVRVDGKLQRDARSQFVESCPMRLEQICDREHGHFGVVFIDDGNVPLKELRVFEQADALFRVAVIGLHVQRDAGEFLHAGRLVT
jgi:hypothetical protein